MVSSPDDFAHLKIPLQNLLSATKNFAEENVIGTGGISNLYKGQLFWSGELIDIRAQRFNKDLKDREHRFWMEISMLSSLKHKNLVSLVGFCDENDKKIIIIRREIKGSLSKHLSDPMRLTWVRRLEISVALANALSYIHYDELRDFSVIHRSIASGAVLLNDNWEPKLSRFEDSMKIKASQRHHSFHTNTFAYVKGYVDPTYIETKSVNHKSDMYSFGIVLLELLCGRESMIDKKYYNQLVPLAITLYREKKLISIIDKELLKQMDLHSFNMFADIACECLDEERSRRPNIDDILPRLEKALELQLKPQKFFQHLKIELQAIKSATNEFDDSHCIGKGGFGEVYKGELIYSKGQSVVAFKRLNRRFGQGDIEFWKEIIMLSSYRHNNIVSLLGFCDDCGEKILVYEYAPRKSLDLYLNDKDLTWVQRLEICIGAARGLAYLHNPGQNQQRVLHRDIKSSNILLDENWNARIADFGLSKLGPANQPYTFLVSNAVGTIGYCDPLYAGSGFLTKESDVYSFGVVLFEMLCGRLCIRYKQDEPLTELVRKCYKQNTIDEIVYGNIKDEINPHSLKAFTTIAYQCLKRGREQCPLMTMVVNVLESALQLQVSNVPPPPSLSPAESSASPNESSIL
ncbi:protein kinase-like domain-containing protein [Artemisia annua]|uniref:Protein kinase-like domain-containing protein n=1 Tax=Artemisia annua TaxID=35608 RepID=A0A2U1P8W1_ARTAN|nr:protein kinase-like domain-containing protein [Artemisia annua]